MRALCVLAFLKIAHTFTHMQKNSANRHCHNEQFQKRELVKFNFLKLRRMALTRLDTGRKLSVRKA